MKKVFVVLLFACHLLTAYCQLPYFQQLVNYKIDVSLNDADNTIDGYIKMDYTNNSPDTLRYIWFHLWPNAYKNDKTAFSDQLLQIGRTDFYFSGNEKRGYINRLDFKVNGITAKLEDHPQYIDVAKLVLPLFLAPGGTVSITTPFHVKLPFNFSRGGYVGQSYQVTQWYPKPAVYDNRGWHPMPYLDQGEFYSEFGSFDVQITVPQNYVIAATGELQNEDEKMWMLNRTADTAKSIPAPKVPSKKINEKILPVIPLSSKETKTLHYLQNNVHDFAWFADKTFLVQHDTCRLASGRIIDAYSFYTPSGKNVWKNSIQFIKDAVRTRSQWLGEYPYNVVTALEAKMGFDGGMEYPTITSISPENTEQELDLTIEHEVGHNWNYGILASNERNHPWMDEGINTYFDNRYMGLKYPGRPVINVRTGEKLIDNKAPGDVLEWLYQIQLKQKRDQPIETISEKFSPLNYNLVAYYKSGKWMKVLENYIGKNVLDSSLHEYYNRWKFKHPYPEDFKKIVGEVSGRDVDSIFSLLEKKGDIIPKQKRDLKLSGFLKFKETEKYNYIFLSPSFGYNYYDNFMAGALVHNYHIPSNNFQFFAAPMYATGSKKLVGLARAGYTWHSYGAIQKAELSVNAAKFTVDSFTDSTGKKNYLGFNKIVPSLKITFREKNAGSTTTKFVQWKTFFIQETGLLFTRDTMRKIDVISYPKINSYINQLRFVVENARVLYPYSGEVQAEQGRDFVRTQFTGNYFFNYGKGGGMNLRLFAGKFFYIGDKTFLKQFATDRYHLNMTGPKGYEDYTYSNYFIGRNEFEKFSSQQIMIRDGGFKVRTDLLASKIGKTDDWLAALNFKTTLPKGANPLEVLPVRLPVKIFFDLGTYAEAWKKSSTTGKFIYDAGVQLSLLKDLINIYIPVFYSKVYKDYFKSTIPGKLFWKNISFSVDIQNFNLKKLNRQIPF